MFSDRSPIRLLLAHRRLLLLGLGCELIYALYFLRRFSLLRFWNRPYRDMGQLTGHSHLQLVLFLAAFAALFLLVGLAWQEVRAAGPKALPLLLGFGAVFGFTMALVYPITALDIFTYIDQSLIIVQYHQNPIVTAPVAHWYTDPLMRLSGAWAWYGAPYGPLGITLDAIPTLLVGRNVLATLLILKLSFAATLVACAFVAYRILHRLQPRYALSGCLLIAWNPLLLFEGVANGHNDVVMVLFLLLGVLATAEGELTLGAAVLVLSILVKYATAPLLPLFLLYGAARQQTWSERLRFLASTAALLGAIAVAAYLPFWHGWDTFRRSLVEDTFHLYSFSSLLTSIFPGAITAAQASILGRILFAAPYLAALWAARRSLPSLLRSCFVVSVATLALAVNDVKYWYFIAPCAIAAVTPDVPVRLAALLMAYGVEVAAALNVYVWVWLGVTASNFRPLDVISYILLFAVPALVLVAAAGARLHLAGARLEPAVPGGAPLAGISSPGKDTGPDRPGASDEPAPSARGRMGLDGDGGSHGR